jgi:hypothetical protein
VGGPEEIREAVAKVPFLGCRVDLSEGSLDAQTSGGGVLIVVTGDIVLSGEALRHFVQTFFLDSQQAGPSPSYYVRNSVLRLLRQHHHAVAAETQTASADVASPVFENGSSKNETATLTIGDVSAPVEVETAAAPLGSVETAEETASSEPDPASDSTSEPEDSTPVISMPSHSTPDTSPAAESPPVTSGPSGPLSYRDMVRAGANKPAAPAPAPAPAPKKKPAAVAPKPAAAPAPASASSSAAAKENEINKLHVRLPDTATVDEVKAIFTPFGAVVHCDVLNARGYAFVTMESEAAKAAVLAAKDTLMLKGKPLQGVEERNVNSGRRKDGKEGGKADSKDGGNKGARNFRGDKAAGAGENKEGGKQQQGNRNKEGGNKDKSDADRPKSSSASGNRNNSSSQPSGEKAANSAAAKK